VTDYTGSSLVTGEGPEKVVGNGPIHVTGYLEKKLGKKTGNRRGQLKKMGGSSRSENGEPSAYQRLCTMKLCGDDES